jgi:hypothetical protein
MRNNQAKFIGSNHRRITRSTEKVYRGNGAVRCCTQNISSTSMTNAVGHLLSSSHRWSFIWRSIFAQRTNPGSSGPRGLNLSFHLFFATRRFKLPRGQTELLVPSWLTKRDGTRTTTLTNCASMASTHKAVW